MYAPSRQQPARPRPSGDRSRRFAGFAPASGLGVAFGSNRSSLVGCGWGHGGQKRERRRQRTLASWRLERMTACRSNETMYVRADADAEEEKDDEDEKEKRDFSFFLFRLSHPHVT